MSAGPVEFHHGFISGNSYRDMPTVGQQGYVIGVVDGMLTAPAFGAPSGMKSWLGKCIDTGIRSDQLKAIVDKYLSENPDRWDDDMAFIILSAILPVCRARGFNTAAN
jgi:hypothetical protein